MSCTFFADQEILDKAVQLLSKPISGSGQTIPLVGPRLATADAAWTQGHSERVWTWYTGMLFLSSKLKVLKNITMKDYLLRRRSRCELEIYGSKECEKLYYSDSKWNKESYSCMIYV